MRRAEHGYAAGLGPRGETNPVSLLMLELPGVTLAMFSLAIHMW
jgi:hypothetical protein